MMLRIISGLSLVLASACVLAGSYSGDTLSGGVMSFQGEVIAETCRVVSQNGQLVIPLGLVIHSQFHTLGEDVNPTPFDIYLEECSSEVSQRVSVGFRGIANANNPDLLSINAGHDAAQGVGVALYNERGQLIPLNSEPRNGTKPGAGAVKLHFVSKYRSTRLPVTDGLAHAQAMFLLTYQ
ncbi:fimbrial protein [Dryocola clanedunensis]